MKAVLDLLHDSLAHQIGWVLIHSLWQGALAAGFLKLLRFFMRESSANSRYLIGCGVLLFTAAAPVFTFYYLPVGGFEWFGHASSFQSSPGDTLGSGTGDADASGFHSHVLKPIEALAPWLVGFWTAGVLISLFRLTQGYWQLEILRRQANGSLDQAWFETLQDLKCRLNISRPVRLLKSSLVEVPMVIGWLTPVVLLPAGSLLGLTPLQLEAILAHELAHIRRHDYLVNVFQVLIETLMFYHPAVWWISGCIREERENCCDDMVMRVCEDRLVYAQALTRLEEMRSATPQLAFAANGGPLLKRIRRLLGVSSEDRPLSWKEVGGMTLISVGLIFIIAGVSLLIITPPYHAVARLKIDSIAPAQLVTNDGKVSFDLYDPYFVQTEHAVISSDAVLTRVLTQLQLDAQWSRRFGGGEKLSLPKLLALLRAKLELKPVRATGLIDIRVSSDKPDEAARIANAVANAYKEIRQSQRLQISRGGILPLEERFRKQEIEIEDAQKKVIELRKKLQIPDALASMDSPTLMTADTLRKIESQRIETKAELVKQETLFQSLKKLTPEELSQAIPTIVQDGPITSLVETRNAAEQSLAIKRNSFGPEHEEIRKLKSQIADLNEKIQKRMDGFLFSLGAKVEALRKSLNVLEMEVNAARTYDIAKAQELQPYYEAKNKLDQLKRFSQMLSLKIAAENIDVALPKSSMIEIIAEATAPPHPISLNRYRGAACSVLGLLLAIAGMMLLKQAPRTRPTSKLG
jgi:beta-lactamase regulating signal transducer with metallopeptidase domain/uncharacterized protein involved in exopolysaccharide biosynthesis